jgi:hypothetical protein
MPDTRALLDENIERFADALQQTLAWRPFVQRLGAADHVCLLNVAQFVLLWNADLAALLGDLHDLRDNASLRAGWRRKLAARQLALTIVEAVDRLRSLCGQSFRESIVQVGGDPLLTRVNELHRRLHVFSEAHDEELRRVRNTIVGHRDADASTQIEALRTLSVDAVEQYAWSFVSWNTDMFSLLSDVMAVGKHRLDDSAAGAVG